MVERYAAFISYNQADQEAAEWLHRRLENYQIPKALAAQRRARRLGRVFLDRVELPTAHDLGEKIRAALDLSDALVLLCSPPAARSVYVESEIKHFKSAGKAHRIFAVIIDGEPHAKGKPGRSEEDECFPRALLYRLGPDGAVSDVPEAAEPLAADLREGKDGRENGALKIIAGLLGVGMDDLVQRERVEQGRRRRRAYAIAVGMAALALGAGAAGVFAAQQRDLAQQSAARALAELRWAQRTESLRLAEIANTRARAGDTVTATLLALHALPQAWSPLDRPVVAAAVDALAFAGRSNKEVARAVIGRGANRCVRLDADGRAALVHLGETDDVAETAGRVDVAQVAFDPATRRIAPGRAAICSDCSVLLFDQAPPEATNWIDARRVPFTGVLGPCAVSPDRTLVASATESGDVEVRRAATGELMHTLSGHSRRPSQIAFRSDGRGIASAGFDAQTLIWTDLAGRPRRIPGDEHVLSVAWAPGSDDVYTGSYYGTLQRVPGDGASVPENEQRMTDGMVPHIRSLAVLRSVGRGGFGGGVAAAYHGGVVRIWNGLEYGPAELVFSVGEAVLDLRTPAPDRLLVVTRNAVILLSSEMGNERQLVEEALGGPPTFGFDLDAGSVAPSQRDALRAAAEGACRMPRRRLSEDEAREYLLVGDGEQAPAINWKLFCPSPQRAPR